MRRGGPSASRRLSWLLRHGALEAGLPMDAAGWADIADVCAVLGVTREVLDEAVRDNDKQRLEVARQRIRASQGHTMSGRA